MSSSVYVAIAIVVLLVIYRAIKREKAPSLSATDRRFAKESNHEGLRCLGYATAPNSDNDAEAYRAGYEQCKRDGAALLAVSLISSGMCAHYALNRKRDATFSAQLSLLSNELLAAEFEADATKLWDDRNALFNASADAKIIVEVVTKLGFSSCRSAQSAGELTSALRKVVGR